MSEDKKKASSKAKTAEEKKKEEVLENIMEELEEEAKEKETAQTPDTQEEKDDAEKQRDKFAHMVKVLNAAKEYAELLELQNDEKALTAQIRELEHGTQDSRILSLKYSLSLLAAKLIQQTESDLHQEESARKEQSDALYKVKEKIGQLTTQLHENNTSLNQTIGSKNIMLEQINWGLSELALHITVMLDGSYSKEDIESIRTGYDKMIKNANEETKKYQNEAEQLGQELDAQDAERTELTQVQANFNVRLQQYETAMEQYRKAYNAVLPVLEHHFVRYQMYSPIQNETVHHVPSPAYL